jgi:hypothetical protein
VGDATTREAGIVKLTLRVLPRTVAIAVAVVVALGGPALTGVKVTETLAARMVPIGNPEPVTLMFVTPACPAPGVVGELRVTAV